MAKKTIGRVKLQLPAGKAAPGQAPIGPALAPYGINMMEFIKRYNADTASQMGSIVPVEVTIYEDRSFSYVLKTPPTSELLRKVAGVEKGCKQPGREKPVRVPREKLVEIARVKMRDLNTEDLEAALRVVEGTARSMGFEVA